jgi:hypothetical protein
MAKGRKIKIKTADGREFFVEFKWSVSRGRLTYGYNICTAYVDGERVGRSMGGGYDMEGAALDKWLEQFVRPEHNFYGLNRRDDGSFYLDGACGLDTLLRGLGLEYRYI